MKNIVLIGFMGTGKTSVGKRLAARLGRNFLDTDNEIEKITGRTVADIFAGSGEKDFRTEENLLAKGLARRSNLVIATGGGMVLNPANTASLKENGVLILLYARPDVIWERVKRNKTRPLLAVVDLPVDIEKLMDKREESYCGAADYCIDTSLLDVGQVVDKIINLLASTKRKRG